MTFRIAVWILGATMLWPPFASAGELPGCSDLYVHFEQEIEAWAAAEPSLRSVAIKCEDGVLSMHADVTGDEALVFTPDVTILAETLQFYGLAAYYNDVRQIDVESIDGTAWQGWKGRFAALLVDTNGVAVGSDGVELSPASDGSVSLRLGLIDTHGNGEFAGINAERLRYTHLWGWLRGICLLVEKMLIGIQGVTGFGWGLAIILLCAVIKIALIPVTMFVAKQQQRVGEVQSALEQPLKEIKANYDGQEAHERIMAAHKEIGVSPFYTLRPMLGMFVQLPILIAVFNMLGELPQLSGATFLWIADLAYPDAIWQFMAAGSGIPLFGNTLNLLPVLMTAVTVAAAFLHQDSAAPASETRKQKRNLYLMAIAFFVLFYPFPAAMVLYWATANVLQVGHQLVKQR